MSERSHIARNSSLLLSLSLDDQDRKFFSSFEIIREAIAHRVFPAASVAVTHRSKLVVLKSFGRLVYEEDLRGDPPLSRFFRQSGGFDGPDVTPATLFDLASLTKPIATTTMAMMLYERGQLDLEAPIEGTISEFTRGQSDSRRLSVTFRHLLTHSSGLPAYEKLFLKAHTRDQLLHGAFAVPLSANPGRRAEYSDIGFIILGVALERLAEEPLDAFCQREIFGPIGLSNTTFNPPPGLRPQIPPTADERTQNGAGEDKPRSSFRERIIQGEVQDENASALGGVAGHAGLFSTAEDVTRFAQTLLMGGNPILRPETISLFTSRQSSPPGTSRTLGWDTPTAPSQSGKYFGPRSWGHLGYTGTSLWIDPDRELSITVLTNRTWPDCSNQAIRQLRPKFHDAVIEALG